MAHKFVVRKTEGGQYRAYFQHNGETIFWTETYASKASAREAIASIQKNGPAAPIEES